MPFPISITESFTALGLTFPSKYTETYDNCVPSAPDVAPAKVGQLTTRTDANTGTLTMAASHGITTGARLDLYWSGGMRRGIVVGTVSVNSVPFDLGSGDDLPTNLTAITAMVPDSETLVVTGDNALAILLYSSQAGQIVFCLSDNTEVAAFAVGGVVGTQQSYCWTLARNPTNPLAGAAVTKAFFSHGSSANTANMRAAVFIN